MKLIYHEYGTVSQADPIVPKGVVATDPATGTVKVGNGVQPWSVLPTFGGTKITSVNSVAEIPAGTAEGSLFVVKGAAQAAQLQRVNRFQDPDAKGTLQWSTAFGTTGLIADAMRWTRTTAGSARLNMITRGNILANSDLAVRVKVRSSEAWGGNIRFRPTGTSNSTGEVNLGAISVPAGEYTIVLEGGKTSATTVTNAGSVLLGINSGSIGMTVDVMQALIEASPTVNPFHFSGASVLSAPYSVAWNGTVNDSTSNLLRTPYAASLYIA